MKIQLTNSNASFHALKMSALLIMCKTCVQFNMCINFSCVHNEDLTYHECAIYLYFETSYIYMSSKTQTVPTFVQRVNFL